MKNSIYARQIRSRNTRRRFVVEPLEGRALLTAIPTATFINVSTPAIQFGQNEVISAKVTSTSDNVKAPNVGTLTFFDGTTVLGTASVSMGEVMLTTSSLSVGTHSISASYSGFTSSVPGAASFALSTSTAVQSVVPTSGLVGPEGTAVDAQGDVFIVDTSQNRVIKVTPSGTQTIVPTTGLSEPIGVAVDSSGNLFVADTLNRRVVKVTPTGTQTAVGSGLDSPEGVAVDAAGDVFIADSTNNRVIEVTPAGTQTTVASGLSNPEGVAVDPSGNLFIADNNSNSIIEVSTSGTKSTFASAIEMPHAVAVDAAGNVFVAANSLIEITKSGTQMTIGSGISLAVGVAVDSVGDIFVSDAGNDQVLEESPGPLVSVSANPTSTTLDTSATTTVFNQPITFTATVREQSGTLPAPAQGTVTFFDGGNAIGTSAVMSNPFHTASQATFTTSALTAGSHVITASYNGSAGYLSSTTGIPGGEPPRRQASPPRRRTRRRRGRRRRQRFRRR